MVDSRAPSQPPNRAQRAWNVVYVVRPITAAQSGTTRPGTSVARVSMRRRCSCGSEQITSTSTTRAPARAPRSRHASRVTIQSLTESVTMARPKRRLSPATANAARYPASSIDPGRIAESQIACSIESILNQTASSFPANSRATEDLPVPGSPAKTMSMDRICIGPGIRGDVGPKASGEDDSPLRCKTCPCRLSRVTCRRRETSPFAEVVSTRFPPHRSHACMTGARSGGRP